MGPPGPAKLGPWLDVGDWGPVGPAGWGPQGLIWAGPGLAERRPGLPELFWLAKPPWVAGLPWAWR